MSTVKDIEVMLEVAKVRRDTLSNLIEYNKKRIDEDYAKLSTIGVHSLSELKDMINDLEVSLTKKNKELELDIERLEGIIDTEVTRLNGSS